MTDAISEALTSGGYMSGFPIRQKSANGQPPPREFVRRCGRCSADFIGLAAGKTGERGLWSDCGRWFCSQECWDNSTEAVSDA